MDLSRGMTSCPYIDSGTGAADHALLRVSNPRITHQDIGFTKSLAKVCDTTLRAKDVPNALADSERLLFTSASELPPLPPLPKLGKKGKAEFNTPPKPLTGLHLERENNLAAELAAKRKLCSLRKALTRAGSESALQEQLVQRHKDARKLRAEQDERSGSKYMKDLARSIVPATSAESCELGTVLLEAFSLVEPDPRCRGWYKLFKHSKQQVVPLLFLHHTSPLASAPFLFMSSSSSSPSHASLIRPWACSGHRRRRAHCLLRAREPHPRPASHLRPQAPRREDPGGVALSGH